MPSVATQQPSDPEPGFNRQCEGDKAALTLIGGIKNHQSANFPDPTRPRLFTGSNISIAMKSSGLKHVFPGT